MNYDPNDLLSQISAQDEGASTPEKQRKRRSISIDFAVIFMKLTFAFDDMKRQNQGLFKFLSILWSVFMSAVYLGGIAMLGLLIYSYGTFPDKVRDTLIAQGIITKNYDIESISLSKIELKNLEDKDGTYSIKKMIIHSTFADFIRGRVKSVELNGVTLKITEEKDGINFGKLPMALINLNQTPAVGRIKVGNLQVNNSVIQINGTNYSLPVSFHLTGVYERESKIIMDLTVRKDYVKMNGVLSITGTAQKMDFNLKINAGTLELPQRSPENIVGEVTVSTRKMVPDKITGHVDLSYGNNSKKVNLSMTKSGKGFNGNVTVNIVQGKTGENQALNANIATDFSELKFETPYRFNTEKPLKLKVVSFKTPVVNISNLTATLNGKMTCDHLNCSYEVQKSSPFFIKEFGLLFTNDTIKSAGETSFSFAPNKKQTFVYNKNAINYDMKLSNVVFSGYRNTSVMPVSLTSDTMQITGNYHIINQNRRMVFSADKINLSTPEITLRNATFERDNVFDERSKLSLTAEQAEVAQNDLLQVPFKLSLEKTDGLETKAQMTVDNVIQISFAGVSRLLTGEFNGNLYIPEFDLGAVKTPLPKISSLFPSGVSDISGKVSVLGRMYFKNAKQVSGPLFVSLKDIGFALNNAKVSGLNTVLTMQSVAPLVSAANQKIFVANVTGAIPFQNLTADIKLDNQFLKVAGANLTMAGIPMAVDTTFVSLKSDMVAFHLKNNAINLAQVSDYLNLDGATMSGKGSVSATLGLSHKNIFLNDVDVKISGAEIKLDKVQKGKIKSYFGDNKTYTVRSGTIFADSINDEMVNMNISLDGRLMPAGQMKNVRETLDVSLDKVIKPVTNSPIPEDIVRKQQVVVK